MIEYFHDQILCLIAGTIDGNDHRGCAYLQCKGNDVCVHRKFRCKDPPCPNMLYCARSRTESLRGPSTCDTVHCTNGYMCTLKVRRCHWDEKCEQQIARCVSQKEYYEGPASCAGFKCPQGNHCILRESFCANPPCKLIQTCMKNKDVQLLFVKCRHLGCPSEYECFLRRPESDCASPPCRHTPDCIMATENEMTNVHCRGWVCPRMQTCSAKIVESCETNDCNIKRICHESHAVAANDSSSSFSRRSLKNKDEISLNDTEEVSGNTDGVEKAGTPESWLNHLKSKTELDAIELWIKHAEEHKDFKQFQDWLRSIKDILGSAAYSGWLEEILSSRGEQLRKWLRASHDKLNVGGPIFPGQERPGGALTENPYVVGDTMNTSPLDDSNKEIEKLVSLLRERNLTNILERILVPSRVLLPPYVALDAALLNNARESDSPSFSNYLLKYPPHVGSQFLPLRPQKTENTYDQRYLVVPVKNMKELTNSQIIDYNSNIERYHEITPENEKMSAERDNSYSINVPERKINLSSTRNDNSSLKTGLYEDFEKKLPRKETHSEDSIGLLGDKRLMGKAQHFDDVPVDFLEKFLKSMQLFPIENVPQTFDEKSIEEYRKDQAPLNKYPCQDSSKAPENEKHDENFEWDLTSRNKNSEENEHQVFFSNDDYKNFTSNIKPSVNTFFDKLDRSNDVHSELSSTQIDNKENEKIDLNLFFELNKESLLPYIQTILQMINEELDTSSRETELNFGESSLTTSVLNSEEVTADVTDYSELESLKTEPNNVKKILNNNSQVLEETFDKIFPKTQIETASTNSQLQQERESGTPELIYANEEPTIRSFYNLPSYGASNDEIDLQDYIHFEYNQVKRKNGHEKSGN
ncbi:uncharacterized protein LOC122531473 isoform X2 [Frieseomelitta varia]|uniref:uncharacterized protein LOC122531473 isoform X2 n=1 Tax=Frieseomelitta varia TaxID=561572 RepID=UPI001CB68C9C|nr:uncharacterized protein LOC122531473 isoform X2 [Frieseomelitta varia]